MSMMRESQDHQRTEELIECLMAGDTHRNDVSSMLCRLSGSGTPHTLPHLIGASEIRGHLQNVILDASVFD